MQHVSLPFVNRNKMGMKYDKREQRFIIEVAPAT